MVRVCAKDRGGKRFYRNSFTSFSKQLLDCDTVDGAPLYIITSAVHYNGSLIASFWNGHQTLPISALCIFRMEDLDRTFDKAASIWPNGFSTPPSNEEASECGCTSSTASDSNVEPMVTSMKTIPQFVEPISEITKLVVH